MKSFKQYIGEKVKEPTGKLKSACWTGYTAVGMKNKGGRQVPNCVPVKEDGGAMGGAPANNVGGGNIAGSGGKGGEPGVNPRKKKNPIMMKMGRRSPPKM